MLPHQKISYLPFLELNSIQEIVHEFALGGLIASMETNNGSNESFSLTTDKGVFQIKSYSKSIENPDHFAPVIQREISFTNYLEDNGFTVQHHLSFQPFLYQGKLSTITATLEGKKLGPGIQTKETISKMGSLLGNLHQKSSEFGNAGAGYEQRNSFRDRVDANVAKIEELLGISSNEFLPLLNKYNDLRSKREETDKTIPRGLTHGEITYVNLLEKGNSFAILNFDGLKFVPHIFDFGQTLISMTFDGSTFHKELITAFFDAYQKIRELSEKEKDLITSELVYNFLHKIEWRMCAMLNNPGYIEIVKLAIRNAASFMKQLHTIDEIIS